MKESLEKTDKLIITNSGLLDATKEQVAAAVNIAKAARDSSIAAKSSAISAEKSATVTEKIMVGINRPWLSIRLQPGSGLKFDSNGGRITIRFWIKNIGNSPAVGITLNERIILNNPVNIQNMRAKQKDVCDSGSNLHRSIGYMLFPGEEMTYDVSSPISKDDITEGKKEFYEAFKSHMNAINPVIVGCVRYGFTFDESRRRTSFMASLSRKDVKNPAASLLIDPNDGDVPPELIRLDYEDYLGGNFAE
ncbi:MAG: hypothetical protein CSYNP_01859 [Syntrophus sp. SKADARSKE-3]|nr:hypothetical protein [Syntrophus sp. SKADARSKE-3]